MKQRINNLPCKYDHVYFCVLLVFLFLRAVFWSDILIALCVVLMAGLEHWRRRSGRSKHNEHGRID